MAAHRGYGQGCGGLKLAVYDAATLPTAAEAYRGVMVIYEAASTDDAIKVCRLTSGGTYEWVTVTVS